MASTKRARYRRGGLSVPQGVDSRRRSSVLPHVPSDLPQTLYTYVYIYIYIYMYIHIMCCREHWLLEIAALPRRLRLSRPHSKIVISPSRATLHPVSITRFPLTRFSPGSGLLRNPFFHRWRLRFSRVWVRKDGNLVTETGCKPPLLFIVSPLVRASNVRGLFGIIV